VALSNLGTRIANNSQSGTLFKEKILHARELPSEVQISMTNLGNSHNTWTIYARNPVAVNNNPLAIQTRLSSNPGETLGIANRLISEIAVQRNTYSGINLLPCWYGQLKLGNVIALDIGTRQLSLQLSNITLTENFIVQIEGNQYINSQYSTIYLYHVFVVYTNTKTYLSVAGNYFTPSIVYTRTSIPFVGSADNLQIVQGNSGNGISMGVLGNNGTFIPLLGPAGSGVVYGSQPTFDPSQFLSTLDTSLVSTNSNNLYPGQPGLNPNIGTNFQIVMVVQVPDNNQSHVQSYDIYNNSAFFGPNQVTNNAIPQTPSITYPPVVGNATLIPLDIPLISDNDPPFTIYFAVKADSNFTTGQVFYSTDGGTTYSFALNVANSNAVGELVGTMPNGTASIIDTSNSFVVSSSKVINNCTTDQFLASTNLILVGDEIIAFRDVTLLGANQYKLSYLIRGLRGTEWAMNKHTNGEQIVLLQNLFKLTAKQSYINQTILYKLAPAGVDETDITNPTSFTYQAVSVKPYSVVDPYIVFNPDSTITINWIRRTYLNGGLKDYTDIGYAPGEIAQYLFQSYDPSNTNLINTRLTNTESFVYTPAEMMADFNGVFNGSGTPPYIRLSQASTYVGKGQQLALPL